MDQKKNKPASIFMDRHNVSETVTAEHVAQLHQEDLKVQQKFGCRGLTYWFDEKRKTAFCLVEAPDKQAIQKMHDEAHGDVPHSIIEVDANIVESFLGRIEDPEEAKEIGLNVINDPAFRTIMVIEIKKYSFNMDALHQMNSLVKGFNKTIFKTVPKFNGRLVKHNEDYFLVSFNSVSKAVSCAVELHNIFDNSISKLSTAKTELKIGLDAGLPVTEKPTIFEETIKFAERMCQIAKAKIVLSAEVSDLYKRGNSNIFFNDEMVLALTKADEKFLNVVMDYTEKTWQKTDFKVENFSKYLGYSKSRLYRKMVSLSGKSINKFMNEYRLNMAFKLLNKKLGNISEIAFETGFNSPSYFSKCFQKKYGLAPSNILSPN